MSAQAQYAASSGSQWTQSAPVQATYQTTTSQTTSGDLSGYELVSEGTASTAQMVQTGQMYYSKPVITHTQNITSTPVVTRKIITQPVITKRIVSQPIIRQRIVQTPIIRKTIVQRPVYTKRVVKKAITENQTVNKTQNINVPGQLTIRERYNQPSQHTITQNVNVVRGETRRVNHPAVTR